LVRTEIKYKVMALHCVVSCCY